MNISLESFISQIIVTLKKDQKLNQVILASSENEAQKLLKLCKSLANNFLSENEIVYVPGYFQTGVYRYESAKKIIAKRIENSYQMSEKWPRLFIVSVAGYIRTFPSSRWVSENVFSLKIGDDLDTDLFLEELSKRVYTQVPRVEEIGEYAVRGSLVDFWTPGQKYPTRVELFGDAVEKIRSFRVEDQRSFDTLNSVNVLPSREFIWPSKSQLEKAIDKFNQAILHQRLMGVARTNLLEDLKANVPFAGIDDLYYMFTEKTFTSLEEQIKQQAKENGMEISVTSYESVEQLEKSFQVIDKIYENALLASESKNILNPKTDTLFPQLDTFPKNLVEVLSEVIPHFAMPSSLALDIVNLEKQKFSTRANWLQAKLSENNDIEKIVFCSKSMSSLVEFSGIISKYFSMFENFDVNAEVSFFSANNLWDNELSIFPLSNNVFVTLLDIENGFYLPNKKTFFVAESWVRGVAHAETFESFQSNSSQGKTNSEIFMVSKYSEYVDGDLVVHVQHGIARFRGLMTITLMDISGDFLVLEFANNDKVYVPIHKLNLVQKYIGASDSVTLDSLKSSNWEKKKEKARKDVEKIAKELMEYQAKRAMTPGYAFGKIDEDYISFEDAFPFDETPDQLKAIQEIMNDMSQPKAMDRLLCGDVGFGKTEVAMRAAYRCVLDGKQVAWLVPTTVLAHQHTRSLRERFQDFAVKIETLDRSVTASSKVLEKLKSGQIDILIGTHRILSKDIAFRELGLLVVDEEQRFGVMQKEKIKAMSYGVDVLTMTATPIPRTLQMALVGLRELSLLHTPPKARLATKTFVCPFDDDILKEAIAFELARGGQIFYVHNRVEELNSVFTYLTQLIPTLKVGIGHGKMSQKDLEKTVLSFLDGQFDVLLCTTIIESGIDMPNVNTIIVQNANHFGLAQLYQLRGRVGRRSTRGYAYFLTAPNIRDDSEGMKRLDILKEHQELGAGFAIASHDLEMRGSGNILGDEQSGRVNEVGLETYMHMLDDAIKILGGVKVTPSQEVEIQLPIPFQIPEDYIQNAKERLKTYRRFFGSNSESALQNLVLECEDRFGELPENVKNLAEVARIRRILLSFGAISLSVGEDVTEIKVDAKILQDATGENETFIKRLLETCNHRVKHMRVSPDGRIFIPLRKKNFVNNSSVALNEMKRILSFLGGEANESQSS